jgi:hypothetical protein
MPVLGLISNFSRVLQTDGCEQVVEAVNTRSETQEWFPLYGDGLLQSGLILDTKVGSGVEGSITLGRDFHFSDAPTVTAGFNVF